MNFGHKPTPLSPISVVVFHVSYPLRRSSVDFTDCFNRNLVADAVKIG